jgi:hypothetical protein
MVVMQIWLMIGKNVRYADTEMGSKEIKNKSEYGVMVAWQFWKLADSVRF